MSAKGGDTFEYYRLKNMKFTKKSIHFLCAHITQACWFSHLSSWSADRCRWCILDSPGDADCQCHLLAFRRAQHSGDRLHFRHLCSRSPWCRLEQIKANCCYFGRQKTKSDVFERHIQPELQNRKQVDNF